MIGRVECLFDEARAHVAVAHRRVYVFDHRPRMWRDFFVLHGVFKRGLDVCLAAFDAIGYRCTVSCADADTQVREQAMARCDYRGLVLWLPAKQAHALLQHRSRCAAFTGARPEQRIQLSASRILGRFGVAVGTVQGGFDQAVERLDVVLVIHPLLP